MNQIFTVINTINIIWIIPVFFLIHELEEWNILNWYKKFYVDLPPSTNISIRIHIITLSIIAFLLTFIAWISPIILRSIIVIYISSFILANTIQHIIWTVQYNAYSPGLLTALFATLVYALINIKLINSELILTPCYLIVLMWVPAIIATVRSKYHMTPDVRRVHTLFIYIESILNKKVFSKDT